MASVASSRGAAYSPRRNSASLIPTSTPSRPPPRQLDLDILEDDYNYHDADPSISATNPKQPSGEFSSPDVYNDPEHLLDEPRTNIYEKSVSGNRAKLPDDFERANGNRAPPDGQPDAVPTATARSKHKRRDVLGISRISTSSTPPRSTEKSILWKVDLHWSREEIEGVGRVSLNACIPRSDASTSSENSVLWQHSNYENIRLRELEGLLSNVQLYGLQESEIGLTKRLIKRIELVSERSFVNGRFLNPKAIRYDMLDDSRYNKDRCSIFLSFPYFEVKKPEEKPNDFKKGEPEHPVRTLLQSRYRLNRTTKRDESQCITELSGDKLKSCTKAPHQATAHLTHRKVEELIYVPQLWTLIIGIDHMITAGPIGKHELHGPTLMLQHANISRVAHGCSFVRISFINRGVKESQIYPISQCTSWFGLLNIHQQLRSVLRQGKEKGSPKDFKLRHGLHTLTGGTWAAVQRSIDVEVLAIWMDTPIPPAVSVQDADGDTITEQRDGQYTDNFSPHETTSTRTITYPTYEELDPVPVVSPFLEWLVLDDFGHRDESASEVKVNRFLFAIYRSLSAACTSQNTVSAPQAAPNPQPDQNPDSPHAAPIGQMTTSQNLQIGSVHQEGSTDQSEQTTFPIHASHPGQILPRGQTPQTHIDDSGRANIFVTGRTSKDVDDLTYILQQKAVGNDIIIEQRLRKEFAKLFSYYVPKTHDEALVPVRLYWGLLYELIERRRHLLILYKKVLDINKWAKRLHLGVFYQRRIVNNGAEELKSAISDCAILQATMIDALGAIFNMLVAAVKESRFGHSPDQKAEVWQRALRYGDEACKLFEKARDKLIAEATGSAPGEGLGPVITPEAILIMLLERLAHGVYGSGTVDVINILEECLEQLALDVEKRPSRRLLKRINAFQEEVDIVQSVLLQQRRVLTEFQTCLDPAGFQRSTTARKMRFKFERSGIERVLRGINDRRRYCKELIDRAKVLEDQNVRLVETLADDNSRAIFIFTFITILFLPLSFVATYFGMNVVGINPTTSTTSHFWIVGAPLTGGILVVCIIFVFKGEDVWFFLADLPSKCVELLGLRLAENS